MNGGTRWRRRVCSATCDGSCLSLADNGVCVPKILPAAELEGSLTGLIVAMPPDELEVRRWAMM